MTRTALVLSLVLFLPGIVYSEVWQGRPIAGQVVGNNSISTGNLHTAALFFEVAHTRATLSFSGEVAGVGLYCGVAGRNGALIWHSGSSPFTETEIVNNELTSTSPAPECDASINNLVSHRAAAEKRLLYVEYEYGGEMRRGQLWPRATGLSDYGHFVEARPSAYQNSFSQLTGKFSANPMRLNFTEGPHVVYEGTRGLSYFHFQMRRYWEGFKKSEIALRCAPAGVEGPIVVELAGTGPQQWLSNADIIPTNGSDACGMAVNNVASLVEALLRGNIYISIENATSVLYRSSPRGQFFRMHINHEYSSPSGFTCPRDLRAGQSVLYPWVFCGFPDLLSD